MSEERDFQPDSPPAGGRRPYEPPVIETLGDALSALLSSQPACTITEPDDPYRNLE